MQQMLEELERRRAAARLGGGQRRVEAQHAKGKLTARERLEVLLDPGSFEEYDMFVEHRCDRFRHGRAEDPGRRRGHRLRHDQRPAGLCLQPGFHRVRRRALGRMRQKICKIMDMAMKVGAPVHRPQRFRRRAHPGRRRFAGRLRRRVPAQRAGLGRDPADFRDHGAVRRRRGLFAGDDRLHLHGEGQLLHVRDRPRRGEDRDARDGDPGGAGRRGHPHRRSRASPISPSRTTSRRCCSCAASSISCRPTTARRRRSGRRTIRSIAIDASLDTLVPANPNKPYDMQGADPEGRRRGRLLRASAGIRRQHHDRLRPHGGPHRSASSPTSRWCWPAASTSTVARKARALRALLRLLQHPDRHLRRRAGLPAGHRAGISAASSSTAPSCSMPMPRRRCPR